jgi:hypothetical protein
MAGHVTDASPLQQEVEERLRLELGSLVQQIIVLRAQNKLLTQEIDRLTAGQTRPASPS